MDKILGELVFEGRKPLLGICVGMQLLADFSEEGGRHAGLGWIPGAVRRFELPEKLTVPHVGWNTIHVHEPKGLFSVFGNSPNFYFDHSYHFHCASKYVSAHCNYGVRFVAAVRRKNIHGVQFHPEKSQNNGLKMFRAFFDSLDEC